MATQRADGISWLLKLKRFKGETWNCQRGCLRKDAGCGGGTPEPDLRGGCYAEGQAIRGAGPGGPYEGLVRMVEGVGPRWTGKVLLVPEKLGDPLRWLSPRLVFVDSMSDTFHENFKPEEVAAIFGVMLASPNHLFNVLTKRHEGPANFMRWVEANGGPRVCFEAACDLLPGDAERPRLLQKLLAAREGGQWTWPARNVAILFSCALQHTLNERLPVLVREPAPGAVRGISAEPQLGPLDFYEAMWGRGCTWEEVRTGRALPPKSLLEAGLHTIITGGESGASARPAHMAWFTSARDQATHPRWGGLAFHHKQHGPWTEDGPANGKSLYLHPRGRWWWSLDDVPEAERAEVVLLRRHPSKHAAGRLLEGRLWDELPASFLQQAEEILARWG